MDSPRLAAELCFDVLKLERIQLYTFFDRIVQKLQLDAQVRWFSGPASMSRWRIWSDGVNFIAVAGDYAGLFDPPSGNGAAG